MPGRQWKCRCRQILKLGGERGNRVDLGRRREAERHQEVEADRRHHRHQRRKHDNFQLVAMSKCGEQ